jgi:hypothetical protein
MSDSHLPCCAHAVLLKAMAQRGRREMACGLPARLRLLPATMRSSMKIVIRSIPILLTMIHTYDCKEWLQHTTKRMICWTVGLASLAISGCHANFHKGHGTIGAGQGRGMGTACYVWIRLNEIWTPNYPAFTTVTTLTTLPWQCGKSSGEQMNLYMVD